LRDPCRRRRFFIGFLPPERDRLFHLSQPDHEPLAGEGNGEVPLSEAAHQVEGLSTRLLLGQSQGVFGHPLLDHRPHVRRGPEEAVRRHHPRDALVRTAEVVGLDEEAHPPLAILEIGKDRPRQELVPQRLPESLDLPQRLRVVGTALDVMDPLPLQLSLEIRVAAPGRVLTTLIRQDLAWSPVFGNATRERFQDQRRALMVGHHQRHHVPRVVVHEGGDVEPVMTAQEEGEDVRLPELIRLRALETVLHWTLFGHLGR
jgi:hypothetical protein